MKKRLANIIVVAGCVGLFTQSAFATATIPDGGSSCLLIGIGIGALAAVKRFLR
jgi:hypothetical protein